MVLQLQLCSLSNVVNPCIFLVRSFVFFFFNFHISETFLPSLAHPLIVLRGNINVEIHIHSSISYRARNVCCLCACVRGVSSHLIVIVVATVTISTSLLSYPNGPSGLGYYGWHSSSTISGSQPADPDMYTFFHTYILIHFAATTATAATTSISPPGHTSFLLLNFFH